MVSETSSSNLRTIVLIGVLCLGLAAITYGGIRMRAQARRAWLNQADQEVVRITDTGSFWLSLLHTQLRGVGSTFYGSEKVTADELFDALEVVEATESAIPVYNLAFVRPADDGRLLVDMSTDAEGLLAVGEDLSQHEPARRAVMKAMDMVDFVVMGPVYKSDSGRLYSLLAFAAPNGDVDGALVTTVDVGGFLESLRILHFPEGVQLRLFEKYETMSEKDRGRIVFGDESPHPETVHTFRIVTDSGHSHWVLNWDILPAYSDGPSTQLANVVQVSGTAVFLLVLFVVGLLSRQNTRVSRLVKERTTELQAATEKAEASSRDLAEALKTSEKLREETEGARREAERYAEEAEAANRAKSVFLANISHEIRTPMNAILGFTEIVKRSTTEPQNKEHLSSIESSGKSLLSLINDLLDLSRAESGSLELQPAAADTVKIFLDVDAVYVSRASDKGLTFSMEVDPGIPRSINVDEGRVSQILGNLVDNAVKFTKSGQVKVSVRSVPSGEKEGFIDLSFDVHDTGIGIPNDQIDELFNAFTQKKGQSINEYGGTGLGLALTHRLVEMMGGRIMVSSEEGVGSTFHVLLPGVKVVDSTTLGDLQMEAEAAEAKETTVSTWSPEDMSPEVKGRLPELVSALKSQRATCEELAATQTVNDVEAFANQMKATAEQYEYPPLEEWSEKLARQTAMFDMDGISASLGEFSSLIGETESYIG